MGFCSTYENQLDFRIALCVDFLLECYQRSYDVRAVYIHNQWEFSL